MPAFNRPYGPVLTQPIEKLEPSRESPLGRAFGAPFLSTMVISTLFPENDPMLPVTVELPIFIVTLDVFRTGV